MKNYPPSFRRVHIDRVLNENKQFMKGVVIDIGGKKINPRGTFIPPLDQVDKWIYVNNDPMTKPDILCDVKKIPVKDQSVDFFLLTEVMEYLDDPRSTISELKRVLKKDGLGIITTPFLNPLHGDYLNDNARYTETYLKKIIELNNLKVLKLEKMGSVGSVFFDILKVHAREGEMNILNMLLDRFYFIFKIVDKITEKSKKFINTGYFILVQNS